MLLGVREICDVVFKAKTTRKLGNKTFYAGEPVIYFDTLKTSSVEGAVTTVYAQGGRGNARLVGWDGDRTVTFNMEDALISPEGLAILAGAGLIEASSDKKIKVHCTDKTSTYSKTDKTITLSDEAETPIAETKHMYVMGLKEGTIFTEPYIPASITGKVIKLKDADDQSVFDDADAFLVDYYTEKAEGVKQIDITDQIKVGNFYVEASTLFRDEDGKDYAAEFVIPNAKVQSNFTFTMASTGDPSTFNFVLDAFPDHTRFNTTEKVFASIQVIDPDATITDSRTKTAHDYAGS